MSKLLICALLVCVCLGGARAQENCNVAQSMTFNANQLAGVWYEIAREPAPSGTYQCVEVDFTISDGNTLDIATTYNNAAAYPWVNNTMTASINSESTNGYNISYLNGLFYTPPAIFKLLATDYVTYALVCGYQDPNDMSTYFGILLMRDRYPTAEQVGDIEEQASESYAQFQNGSMTTIYQSDQCYAPGTAAVLARSWSLPLLAALLGLAALLRS